MIRHAIAPLVVASQEVERAPTERDFPSDTNERLNTKRLANNFNNMAARTIKAMSEELNENYYCAFKGWKNHLSSVIEENITEYNPQLKQISEMIKEETDKINELQDNQQMIISSLCAIKELMDWKSLEQ